MKKVKGYLITPRANLHRANLHGADLPDYQVCPPSGDFIAWKRLRYKAIAKLKIPWYARRTSVLTSRKCRAELALVIEITDKNGKPMQVGYSMHDGSEYVVGKFVKPDKYVEDIREECSHGIHFFITKKEAINFSL